MYFTEIIWSSENFDEQFGFYWDAENGSRINEKRSEGGCKHVFWWNVKRLGILLIKRAKGLEKETKYAFDL